MISQPPHTTTNRRPRCCLPGRACVCAMLPPPQNYQQKPADKHRKQVKRREFGLRECVAQCFFQSLSFFLVYQKSSSPLTPLCKYSLIERILQFGPSTPTDHPNQDDQQQQQQFQQETKRPTTTTTTTTTTARWESCHIVDRWHWASLLSTSSFTVWSSAH